MGITKICVDTNAYTALKRGEDFVIELLENADEVYLPSIVLGELFAGFYIESRVDQNIKAAHHLIQYFHHPHLLQEFPHSLIARILAPLSSMATASVAGICNAKRVSA